MFGSEATKQLDYMKCFPDGYRTGTKMIDAWELWSLIIYVKLMICMPKAQVCR